MAKKARAAPKAAPPPPAATQLPDDGFGAKIGERMATVAELGELKVDSLAADLRNMVVELFKHRDKPWHLTPADGQKDIVGHIDHAVRRMVRRAVGMIAAIDRPGVLCKLNNYGEADGVKMQLSLMPMSPEETGKAILLLHENVRKEVMIVSADADGLFGSAAPAIDEDQTALSFESDTDRPKPEVPPADDSDLNPDGDQSPAIVDQVSAKAAAEKEAAGAAQAPTQDDSRTDAELVAAAAAAAAGNNSENNSAPEISTAAAPIDEGDPSFGVWDPDDKMWLEPDKEFWTVAPQNAGRWSEVRAKQIADEVGDGAEALLIP